MEGLKPRADPSFWTSLDVRDFISIRSLWLHYLGRSKRIVYRTALTISFFLLAASARQARVALLDHLPAGDHDGRHV
jgi:hypothetical protein